MRSPSQSFCTRLSEMPHLPAASAELAQRGLISDDAKLLYEKAVAAAITQWGVEVHEIHIDRIPREFCIVLSVEVEERLLESLQALDPHLSWREKTR